MWFRLNPATKKTRLLLEIHVATTAPAQDPVQAEWEAVCWFPSLPFLLEAAPPWRKKHHRGGCKLSSVFSHCNTDVVPSFPPHALAYWNLLPSQLQNGWGFWCRRCGSRGFTDGVVVDVVLGLFLSFQRFTAGREMPEVLHESKSNRLSKGSVRMPVPSCTLACWEEEVWPSLA